MSNKKDFFQKLLDSQGNKPSATPAKTNINNEDINKLVDTITKPINPEPSPEESLFTSLERAQDKRGES